MNVPQLFYLSDHCRKVRTRTECAVLELDNIDIYIAGYILGLTGNERENNFYWIARFEIGFKGYWIRQEIGLTDAMDYTLTR